MAGAAPPGRLQGGGGWRLPLPAGWSWAGAAGPPRERAAGVRRARAGKKARPCSPWKGCLETVSLGARDGVVRVVKSPFEGG